MILCERDRFTVVVKVICRVGTVESAGGFSSEKSKALKVEEEVSKINKYYYTKQHFYIVFV